MALSRTIGNSSSADKVGRHGQELLFSSPCDQQALEDSEEKSEFHDVICILQHFSKVLSPRIHNGKHRGNPCPSCLMGDTILYVPYSRVL